MAIVRFKKRYQKMVDGIKYDLTKTQVMMLSNKTLKFPWPTPWPDEQTIRSLTGRGLITRSSSTARTVTYKRTEMGNKVYKALTNPTEGK